MEYKVELDVNLPREQLVKKIDNLYNTKHWQHGLVSYELLSKGPKVNGCPNEFISNRKAKSDAKQDHK